MRKLKDILEGIFDVDDNTNNVDSAIVDDIRKFLNDNYKNPDKLNISKKPNKDGKYVVSSNDNIKFIGNSETLTNGLFVFDNIITSFSCVMCDSLKTLEGAPKVVGKNFRCYECDSLKTLEGAPEKVGQHFDCKWCESLQSLKGAPKEVGGNFYCSYCKSLNSLKYAPKVVGVDFYCNNCAKLFTEDDVKKVSKVGCDIIADIR